MNTGPFFRDQTENAPESQGESHSLGATLKRIILWPVHAINAQHQAAELEKLSEHELQDIGLTHQDVAGTHGAGLGAESADGVFDERHDRLPGRRDIDKLQ
ncbi:DUF1127 domain-containing protein [Methylovirgula sp. 4M-Z18]|uniref:DUF1127 domain-containing protein n=1 Tax=Methylovirgula sp. 4M-Z18 TaxID=2293567 RepID=UPI000E2F3900|nr:DUF1127 domain-containing protein [Methylovirgula sp. 4M-Z18]RFB80780.1 DUF1127 domain-containing protein [Methylovirgula sp. 4M-Z18]